MQWFGAASETLHFFDGLTRRAGIDRTGTSAPASRRTMYEEGSEWFLGLTSLEDWSLQTTIATLSGRIRTLHQHPERHPGVGTEQDPLDTEFCIMPS
jgi:hypothetical protein